MRRSLILLWIAAALILTGRALAAPPVIVRPVVTPRVYTPVIRPSIPTARVPGTSFVAPKVSVPRTVPTYTSRPASGSYVHVYDTSSQTWLWVAAAVAANHGWTSDSSNDSIPTWLGILLIALLVGVVLLFGVMAVSY